MSESCQSLCSNLLFNHPSCRLAIQKNQKNILSCAFRTDLFAERQNLRDTMKPIQHDSAADRLPRTRNRMRWIQSKLAMGAFIRSATWGSWRPKVACILPLPSSAGMEIEYSSKVQALSHQKACQSTTPVRWRSGIGAEVLLDNQRYQRNSMRIGENANSTQNAPTN